MELTSIHRSIWNATPKLQSKVTRRPYRPLPLRYALAATVLSMMGAHISADFEEHLPSEKTRSCA